MAIAKTIMRKTHTEVAAKIAGPAGTITISLDTDLLLDENEILTPGETPRVTIAGVVWTGAADGQIQVVRNSVVILTLLPSASGFLSFDGTQFPMPDLIEAHGDIVVTITGTQCELWMSLRKTSGYTNTDYLTLQNT